MQVIKAVLFDLDGTLVDSLPELYEGVARAVADLKGPAPSKEDVANMIGRGVQVLTERVRTHMHLTDADITHEVLLDRIVNNWAETNGKFIDFFPGVLDSIATLRAKGIKTALVTNKMRDLTMSFVKDREVEELFDAVVCGDDCPRNKPSPDMLWRACELLGVDVSQTVMVGDSRNDALAAREAGSIPALVQTGYNEGLDIADWGREAGFTRFYPSAKKVCELIVNERF